MGIGDYVKYYEELAIVPKDKTLICTYPVLYDLRRHYPDDRFNYVTEVDIENTHAVYGCSMLNYILRPNIQRRGYYIYVIDPEADIWMKR